MPQIWYLFLFFVLSSVLVRCGDIADEFQSGFVRVCTRGGDHFETRAKNCPKGVFLKEPIVPGCVCMQGTWVLHSTLCDNSPFIFYGEIEQEFCYQIDFEVQSFLYLGNPNNIFESRTFVAPHSLTVFTELFNGSTTPVLNYHWPSVVAINPYTNVEGLEQGKTLPVCFERREFMHKSKKIKIHIWDNGLGPTSYKIVSKCTKGAADGGYNDFAGTYTDFYYRSNKPVKVPIPGCSVTCDKVTTTTSTTPPTTPFFFSLLSMEGPTEGPRGRKRRDWDNDTNSVNYAQGSVLEKPNIYPEYDVTTTSTSTQAPTESEGTTSRGREPWPFPGSKTGDRILRRQKRYKLRESLHTVWNGIAFCMKSYWDPKLMFNLEEEEERRCYPNTTSKA